MKDRFRKSGRNAQQRARKLAVFVAVMAILLIGCGGSEAAAVSPVVQIKTKETAGSGIVYEQRQNILVIVTAAHVLQNATDAVEVVFADGYVAESGSYTLSQASDIAFIDIPIETLSKEYLQKYRPVTTDKECFDKLAEGEEMTLCGIPDSNNMEEVNGTLVYPWIYAEDFNQYMMLIRGEVLPGMSGGGAFDSAGNFVGIICGVSEEREIAAVPLSIVISEYSLLYD